MDERLKELIAIGASAAVNCHPCLQHHLAECDRLGLDRKEVKDAADVGMMVNRGAAARTQAYLPTLLGDSGTAQGGGGGCGCNG